jgi:hypothetical protein
MAEEMAHFRYMCSSGHDLVARRIPWMRHPFNVSSPSGVGKLLVVVEQSLEDGAWIRPRDGVTFFQALLQTSSQRTAASRTSRDLLHWERYVRQERLLVDDLQFMRMPSGEMWLLDLNSLTRLPNVTTPPAPLVAGLRRPWRHSDDSGRNRLLYSAARQRASLLSMALAAALVARGDEGVALLRSLLCHTARCELGCTFFHAPANVGRMLRQDVQSPAGLVAFKRLRALVGSGPDVPAAVAQGTRCSPCCCSAVDSASLFQAYVKGAPLCRVDGNEGMLENEEALACAFEFGLAGPPLPSRHQGRCSESARERCRDSQRCATRARGVAAMRARGVTSSHEWLRGVYGALVEDVESQ